MSRTKQIDEPLGPFAIECLAQAKMAILKHHHSPGAFGHLGRVTLQELRSLAAGYGVTAYYYTPHPEKPWRHPVYGQVPQEGWYVYDNGEAFPDLKDQEYYSHQHCQSAYLEEKGALIVGIIEKMITERENDLDIWEAQKPWIRLRTTKEISQPNP